MNEASQRLDLFVVAAAEAARRGAEARCAVGERPKVSRLLFGPALAFLRAFFLEGGWRRGRDGFVAAGSARLSAFLLEATHVQMARGAQPARALREAPAFAGVSLPLSATIICQDEGSHIGKCLASLNGFAQIVVVDSGSTDDTLQIVRGFAARGWPIRLIERDWPGYAKQKQFAWERATRDWVLSIDSDEWLDEDLRRDLPALIAAPAEVVGWKLRRPLAIYGQENVAPKDTKPERIIRLARRDKVRFDDSALVHEGLVAEGKVLEAGKGLLRHDRALRIDAQILKEMKYARLKAEQRLLRGKKPSLLKLAVNPPLYFLRVFFLNRVFLYGIDGYILARTRAAYSFIGEASHFEMARVTLHRAPQ
ncbi:MAG TPA: glycosyltransferase family 2 protein [Rhodoblastus sp.]|nr:glycosyltransferase family 2 protein [Rhodoblastus sp.]